MGLDTTFKPIVRFMVASDIHVEDVPTKERDRLESAVRYAYEISEASESYKGLDAIYIVGDFADNGSEISMRAVKDILDRTVREGTLLRLTLASHEYKFDNEAGARKRFDEIFALPADTHEVINGFHFIAVTTTDGCHFRDAQINFASEQLAAAAKDDPKKPIFFFQHPHLSDTVYGSINWGEDELIPTLMDYPQIIDFSGHSHAPINDPRSIHQHHFTSLGTGSMSYFELDEFDKITGTIPDNDENAAQMLIVEADKDNRVRIYPFDVLTGRFFPYVWKIDTPSDPTTFLYTEAKRYGKGAVPHFALDAVCDFSEVTDCDAVVTFDQALPADGEEYVNYYDILVRRKSDMTIVKQISVWSEYYFSDMPARVSRKITGLSALTEYAVEIYPAGFFKNRSELPLCGSVTTKTKA